MYNNILDIGSSYLLARSYTHKLYPTHYKNMLWAMLIESYTCRETEPIRQPALRRVLDKLYKYILITSLSQSIYE